MEGPFLHLEYGWQGDLTHAQADRVDTRLRVYIASAIFDVCKTVKIKCKAGPPHGIRPSWFLGDFPVPYSLVQGSFSTNDKRMYQTVGPIMMWMSPGDFQLNSDQMIKLAQGFRLTFRILEV